MEEHRTGGRLEGVHGTGLAGCWSGTHQGYEVSTYGGGWTLGCGRAVALLAVGLLLRVAMLLWGIATLLWGVAALLRILSVTLLRRVALLGRVLLVLLGWIAAAVGIISSRGIVASAALRVAMRSTLRLCGGMSERQNQASDQAYPKACPSYRRRPSTPSSSS